MIKTFAQLKRDLQVGVKIKCVLNNCRSVGIMELNKKGKEEKKMERKIVGVLVDVENNCVHAISLNYNDEDKNYLDAYYKVLNCDTFDIARRKIGNNYYDIFCDDEGLFKETRKPSAITFSGDEIVEVLVGNLFICSCNEDGETIGLNDEQIDEILNNVRSLKLSGFKGFRNMLILNL